MEEARQYSVVRYQMIISAKRWISVALFALISAVSASQADAMCKGKSQIKLSDGSLACVMAKQTTRITVRRGARKNSVVGGLVALNFPNENDAYAVSLSGLGLRAREICKQYRGYFFEQIAEPGNPFMVVLFTWGNFEDPSLRGRTKFNRKRYLTKGCLLRKAGR
ncbi:MAG: hypothetical protein WA790_01635 [Sulfitobacter sp.]